MSAARQVSGRIRSNGFDVQAGRTGGRVRWGDQPSIEPVQQEKIGPIEANRLWN
jgi:hypothetical protein